MAFLETKVVPLDLLGTVDTANLLPLVGTIIGSYISGSGSSCQFNVPTTSGSPLLVALTGSGFPSTLEVQTTALQLIEAAGIPGLQEAIALNFFNGLTAQISKLELVQNGGTQFSWDGQGSSVGLKDFFTSLALGGTNTALGYFLQGIDTIKTEVDLNLLQVPDLENLILAGAARNVVGNDSNNILTGNQFKNTFEGKFGADDFIISGRPTPKLTLGNADRIIDFEHAIDDVLIDKSDFGIGRVRAGNVLKSFSSIVSINKRNPQGDYPAQLFLYNRANGALYLNLNGDDKGFGAKGGPVALLKNAGSVPNFVVGDLQLI